MQLTFLTPCQLGGWRHAVYLLEDKICLFLSQIENIRGQIVRPHKSRCMQLIDFTTPVSEEIAQLLSPWNT